MLKKKGLKRLICLLLLFGMLSGVSIFAKRNNYEWQGTSTVYFDQGYTSWDNKDFVNCVKRAMSTWNSVTTSSGDPMITLVTSGSRSNTITMVHKPYAEWAGYTTFSPYYSGAVPPHTKISSVLVELNTKYSFADGAVSGRVDLQGIVQHELGHCLGIAHCHESYESPCNGTCINNTMHYLPFYKSVEHRYLKDYDKDSKRIIYGWGDRYDDH